jgi:FAD:protein FMN transferase
MAGAATTTTLRFPAMAGACEIHLAGADSAVMNEAAARAMAEVQRIEAKYSRYRDDSIVSRINAAAGGAAAVEVDAETASLLAFASQLHLQSDGLFDITSGVLRRAWNFRTGVPPTAAQLEALLPLVGWGQVQREANTVRLPRADMELDFGGFGKEYAADRAATLLQEQGVRHGLVNLGGDIRLVGARPEGEPWVIGLQHPRLPGQMMATMALTEGALATSGDYERYFELDGVRYCHVLDPHSGWPVSTWRSVSVVAPACVGAGALTTVAMLKGPDAIAFLESQNVGYLAVDAQGQVHRGGAAASTLN